jgi:hypothetical protein
MSEIRKLFSDGSLGTIAEIPVAPPQPVGKPWRPLFDGKSLGCLRGGGAGWKLENGAIAQIAGAADAGQTREEFEDGEMKIRFEVKDNPRIWFNLRQGAGGGYSVTLEGDALKALEGKPHELIFLASGRR